MSSITVMTSRDIARSLARIAHEIIERNKTTDTIILVGIHTRGVPLAERLAILLDSFSETHILTGTLDISAHRDDIAWQATPEESRNTHIPGDIDNKVIILVDDVLYTGRSIRAAMDALIERGRPQSIQLAVLVDRGHRELPIKADYVGKNIPSARHEDIKVKLQETDEIDEVVIIKNLRIENNVQTTAGGTV